MSDDEVEEDVPDLEVVGLYATSNGRECSRHTCCGEQVEKGTILRLVPCIADTEDCCVEEAVKCVLIDANGVDTCTVGLIPRIFVKHGKVENHLNKFIIFKELYRDSENSYKRKVSFCNIGAASAAFLDEHLGPNE